MPDIVEVHGQVAEVADLPAAAFEGRIFRVTGASPGLYRDNGTSWDLAASGGTGMANPMSDYADIIIGGAGGSPDRLPLLTAPGYALGVVPQAGLEPYRLDYMTPAYHGALSDPAFYTFSNFNGSGSGQSIAGPGVRALTRTGDSTNWIRGFSRGYAGVNFTTTAGIVPMLDTEVDQVAVGLVLQGGGGYIAAMMEYEVALGWNLQLMGHTSSIGDPTVPGSLKVPFHPVIFFRAFSNDNTLFRFDFSFDNRLWNTLGTIDGTAYIGSPTAPSTAGVGWRQPAAVATRIGAACIHWTEAS